MNGQFSQDGNYFGQLTVDGKLKIWNVLKNTFEQEYTPDYHLKSPCTCLNFVQLAADTSKASPKKKVKLRDSNSTSAPHVILGTSSGLLLIYSIAKAELEFTINSATNQSITCLSWDNKKLLYSGVEENILCWDVAARKVRSKWKSGNEKITSVLLIPKNRLLTACRSIKLWDIQSQQVLKSFTGHSSEVMILEYVEHKKNSEEYFISGSKSDRLLSCWTLNETNEGINCVSSFLMEDIAFGISTVLGSDGCVNTSAVTRSGVVHIYQHTLNGKFNKPFKPKTTLQVATDMDQGNSVVTPIPIMGALYQKDLTITIAYGIKTALVFENVVVSTYEKVQCLVRSDNKMSGTGVKHSKSKTPVIENHVRYLTPHVASETPTVNAKRKGAAEVPMEVRLDNLSLNKSDQDSNVPRADNVSRLLLQGLQSKDKNILRSVLSRKDETVIKNTVKRLPVTVIAPLIHELTSYIGGKTAMAHIGSLWLKNLLQVHAGMLVSNPELSNLLGPVLGNIESRLSLQIPLNKLKGRLDLLISQVNAGASLEDEHEPLLTYNDKDASESDVDVLDLPAHSESEENDWMEEESEDEKVKQNGDSESEMSVYELSD